MRSTKTTMSGVALAESVKIAATPTARRPAEERAAGPGRRSAKRRRRRGR